MFYLIELINYWDYLNHSGYEKISHRRRRNKKDTRFPKERKKIVAGSVHDQVIIRRLNERNSQYVDPSWVLIWLCPGMDLEGCRNDRPL